MGASGAMADTIRRRLFVALLLAAVLLVLPRREGTAHGGAADAPPLTPPLPSAPVRETPDPEIQRLRQELPAILTSTGNRTGRWAVLAVSLDRGDTLLALHPEEPMVPASNVKLLSTAAALFYLGPEFRYRTFLLAGGTLTGAALEGDLILYGTGDPTFSDRFFPTETAPLDSLATLLASRGIREVRGDLLVDGSFFEGPDLHPDWKPEDLNDAFAAPVGALSLAENVVTIRVEPGAWIGANPSIFTIPPQAGIPVTNLARTAQPGTRSRIWLLRETPRDPIGIEGEMPLGGSHVWRRLPVPDPLGFAGVQMKRSLEARGIRVLGEVRTVRDPACSRVAGNLSGIGENGGRPLAIIASLESPPLLDLLTVVNKESHNFFAETIGKTLGRLVLGRGSFEGGARAVEQFLIRQAGVSEDQIRLRDASGLSEENRASAGAFIRTLEHLASTPQWELFLETLPQAGVRRELGRMYRSPAAGNLKAKTGTMDRTSALSGIVRTRSGERILFSLLSNGVPSEYRAKRAEDQLGIRLASLTRPLPD